MIKEESIKIVEGLLDLNAYMTVECILVCLLKDLSKTSKSELNLINSEVFYRTFNCVFSSATSKQRIILVERIEKLLLTENFDEKVKWNKLIKEKLLSAPRYKNYQGNQG